VIKFVDSTNVSNCAILLYFVRYVEKENFKEDLLCCINLLGRATGSEIFRFLNEYFSEKNIDWGNCVRVHI